MTAALSSTNSRNNATHDGYNAPTRIARIDLSFHSANQISVEGIDQHVVADAWLAERYRDELVGAKGQ